MLATVVSRQQLQPSVSTELIAASIQPCNNAACTTARFRAVSVRSAGADFRRAMSATAPAENLLVGRRPVRKWTRRTISSVFLCRKLH